MGISGKGLTLSLIISTKRPNKKQKARNSVTDINTQYFRKLLNKFKNLPRIGYKKKKVHNEPTEDYLFLVKQISKILKIKNHVQLCTQRGKSEVVRTKHFKNKIQSGITLMNEEES